MLGEGLVIHQCILGEDADSLADVEVQTCLILGLLHVVLAVRLIHIVTRLDIDSAVLWQLCQWMYSERTVHPSFLYSKEKA